MPVTGTYGTWPYTVVVDGILRGFVIVEEEDVLGEVLGHTQDAGKPGKQVGRAVTQSVGPGRARVAVTSYSTTMPGLHGPVAGAHGHREPVVAHKQRRNGRFASYTGTYLPVAPAKPGRSTSCFFPAMNPKPSQRPLRTCRYTGVNATVLGTAVRTHCGSSVATNLL